MLLTVAVVSLAVRLWREGSAVVISTRRGEAACAGAAVAPGRASAGTVLSEVVCPINASLLDAGVCVELAFQRWGREFFSTRCIPSLAVIGAMKSGTTNLMIYLSMHPRLRTSENAAGWPVESRFFSRAIDVEAALERWREYVSLYPDAATGQIMFDKSPNYVVNPLVPVVLRRLAPSIKLVATVRDPTRRAYSHFQHDCRNGRVSKADGVVRRSPAPAAPLRYPCSPDDFESLVRHDVALRRNVSVCEWSYNAGRGDAGIVARGFYACQLERWLRLFPPSQLLVLVFERFVQSRQATLDAVHAVEVHLGLEAFDYDASLRVALVERLYAATPSRLGAYAPMRDHTRRFLDDLYCRPNQRLVALLPDLGRSPPPWPCLASTAAVDANLESSSLQSIHR